MSKFRVCLYVDPLASMDTEPEEEYEDLEEDLVHHVFGTHEVTFMREVQAHQLKDHPCDVYVTDYGGMAAMPGCDAGTHCLVTNLLHAIQETPNTYFLVWSYFSTKYFKYELCESLNTDYWEDKLIPPNVILWPDLMCASVEAREGFVRLRALLGLPDPPEDMPRRARRPSASLLEDDDEVL